MYNCLYNDITTYCLLLRPLQQKLLRPKLPQLRLLRLRLLQQKLLRLRPLRPKLLQLRLLRPRLQLRLNRYQTRRDLPIGQVFFYFPGNFASREMKNASQDAHSHETEAGR